MSRNDLQRGGHAHFNRANRRSGGDRKFVISPSRSTPDKLRSIQCFEQRHDDCHGIMMPFAPGKCECECHTAQEAPDEQ